MSNQKKLDKKWIDAKKKHRLSREVIEMARQLGMNPKKFGGLDNHRQEPWKMPLPEFIRSLYEKRFGTRHPMRQGTKEASS